MKLSVSLPPVDVQFLDEYAHEHQIDSRSAALQHAIRLLRAADLGDAYEAAWEEWTDAGDDAAWDAVSGDGLTRT